MSLIAVIVGHHGAFAAVDDSGELILLENFPIHDVGQKLVVNTVALERLIRMSRDDADAKRLRAVIDDGTSAAFGAGILSGGTLAAFKAARVPYELAPRGWRVTFGVQCDSGRVIRKAQLAARHAVLTGPCAIQRARCVLLARLAWRSSRTKVAAMFPPRWSTDGPNCHGRQEPGFTSTGMSHV